MKISARSRYGTRLMLALALACDKGPVFLKDIARKEDISEKYLSQIIIPLRTQGLVNSFRGAHGGYSLAKAPGEITVREIVEILEGGLTLIDNLQDDNSLQPASVSIVRQLWDETGNSIIKALDSVTLETLVKRYNDKNAKSVFMYNI
ncbi:MAG: Rrf2 family transcriptional regulator [Candidatus Omnitrophica bacterium]|nr:Rrf2 family transcriptional regulator [Candidatus Omnitrophota bacterium]